MLTSDIKKLAKTVVDAAAEVKGRDLAALDLSETPAYADFLVLVSGGSERQVSAIADNIVDRARESCGRRPLGVEGIDAGQWILIDFGDVVAHVFLEDIRKVYHLEDLWPRVSALGEADLAKFMKEPKKGAAVTRVKTKAATKTAKAPKAEKVKKTKTVAGSTKAKPAKVVKKSAVKKTKKSS